MADSETVGPSPEDAPYISRPDSDSLETPRIPAPEKAGTDEPEDARGSKRRRNCPKALDKVKEFARPDRRHQNQYSFTFDTKFNACSPEFTPKFGSFNFCGQVREEGGRAREDEERGDNEEEEGEEEEEEEEAEEGEEEVDKDSSNPSVINGIGKPLEEE